MSGGTARERTREAIDMGEHSPELTLPRSPDQLCKTEPTQPVVPSPTRPALSDAELDQHIADLTALWMQAYRRFQHFGCPADRDAALELLHQRDAAHLARARRQRAAFGARAEALGPDHGVDYFQSEAALAQGGGVR